MKPCAVVYHFSISPARWAGSRRVSHKLADVERVVGLVDVIDEFEVLVDDERAVLVALCQSRVQCTTGFLLHFICIAKDICSPNVQIVLG